MNLSFVFLMFFTNAFYAKAATCPAIHPGKDMTSLLKELSPIARDNLHKAKDSQGHYIPKETPAEKQNSIVSSELEHCVMHAAYDSAEAEFCGLNSEKQNREPFMAWARKNGVDTDKKAAYAAVLHGMGYATFSEAFAAYAKSGKPCDATQKKNLEKRLASLWK